jgi:hypothetical protein
MIHLLSAEPEHGGDVGADETSVPPGSYYAGATRGLARSAYRVLAARFKPMLTATQPMAYRDFFSWGDNHHGRNRRMAKKKAAKNLTKTTKHATATKKKAKKGTIRKAVEKVVEVLEEGIHRRQARRKKRRAKIKKALGLD